jgi:hypothetical protein
MNAETISPKRTLKGRKTATTTITKVKAELRQILDGHSFTLLAEPTGFGGYHIWRIITTAWTRMPRMERILKMQDALLPVIPPAEQKKILRFSVLNPEEWNEYRTGNPNRPKSTVLARCSPGSARTEPGKSLSAPQRPLKPKKQGST